MDKGDEGSGNREGGEQEDEHGSGGSIGEEGGKKVGDNGYEQGQRKGDPGADLGLGLSLGGGSRLARRLFGGWRGWEGCLRVET